MTEVNYFKKYLAELVGTFVLVLIGCGSAVLAGSYIGNVGISFAFGLAVLAMVYAIGNISGCHINPAITISMLALRKINIKDAGAYIVFQCIGATVGAALIWAIATGNPAYNLAVNGLGQNQITNFSLISGFMAEVAFTFVFLMVIFGSTSEKAPKGFAGIPIGLSLVFIHLVGIPITGTSVNPARSLGPALIVGGLALNQIWIFWIAPIIGGLLAAAVWKIIE